MEAVICVDIAKGGIIEFKTDSSDNVVGSIEVPGPTSEGGVTGRRLRRASMLTHGRHAGSSAHAQQARRQWCTAPATHM